MALTLTPSAALTDPPMSEYIPAPTLMPLNLRRTSTDAAPVWIGLCVAPEAARVLDGGIIWLRDMAQAERICAGREVVSVIFERAGVKVTIDYGSESFAQFIDACRWELAFNPPDFDSPAEEALTREAVKGLYDLI